MKEMSGSLTMLLWEMDTGEQPPEGVSPSLGEHGDFK
jgi:hypothetical protein